MSKIIQKKAEILSNVHLTGNYYKLSLDLPEIARVAQPGQFVMLRLSNDYQPLLRRPFSIHRIVHRERKNLKANGIEILYEVVGRGTKILSEKKPGDYLDVLGSLGNGFSILDSRFSILVGGGIGIAPLLFLAEQMSIQYSVPGIQVLIGAKTKKEILSQKEFAKIGLSVRISTDDGSAGFKGKATGLLRKILASSFKPQASCKRTNNLAACSLQPAAVIFACGPKPMLREVGLISKQYNLPAQISLDEYMACGLGVCLGCIVKTKKDYQTVCKEGPIFDSSEIIW